MSPQSGSDTFMAPPVLVYGPRKAGTTLLQSLLDGGNSLLMLPEELKLKYITRPGWRQKQQNPARWFVQNGRSFFSNIFRIEDDGKAVEVKPGGQLAGLDRPQLEEILDLNAYASGLGNLLRRDPSDVAELIRGDVQAFVAALREKPKEAVCWGSKEVGGYPDRVTSLYRSCFPDGRIVYLVRQPEFIVRAIIMDRRRKGKPMSFHKILHECGDAQNVVNFGLRHSEGGGLVVSYEALTENPDAVMESVCRELGLPLNPIHSGPTTLGKPVVVITSSRQTTKVFRQKTDWKNGLGKKEILAINLFRMFAPLCHRFRGSRMVRYQELRAAVASKGR